MYVNTYSILKCDKRKDGDMLLTSESTRSDCKTLKEVTYML